MPGGKKSRKNKTDIPVLGSARIKNPFAYRRFVKDSENITLHVGPEDVIMPSEETRYMDFEAAGPRERVYFDPSKTKCAIVTCGGLCPGTNDVIRAIVMEAHHNYNVASCIGIRFGLQGFIPKYGYDVVEMTPNSVADIYQFGGTVLGSSRGPQSPQEIVDALERMNINILFMIGGGGTMRAVRAVRSVIEKRDLKISLIGIPKTIDNDINFVSKSFGFDTAVEKATEAINCAHTEAICAFNGIGMVKVMGRESGFIAAQATLALKEVNFVLVPEFPLELTGDNGLLPALERRLKARRHAVIVVAEGAGQHLVNPTGEKDPSGNPRLGDICGYLIKEIKKYLACREMDFTLKFIDPSYIIRSVPANSNDRVYCGFLGQNAVHAGMAGKTGMMVSRIQDRYVHVPLDLVTEKKKQLPLHSEFWRSVLESTEMKQFANQAKQSGDCSR